MGTAGVQTWKLGGEMSPIESFRDCQGVYHFHSPLDGNPVDNLLDDHSTCPPVHCVVCYILKKSALLRVLHNELCFTLYICCMLHIPGSCSGYTVVCTLHTDFLGSTLYIIYIVFSPLIGLQNTSSLCYR